jgi:hypothetical protein
MSPEGRTTEEEIESIVSSITRERGARRPRRINLVGEPEDELGDEDLLFEESREEEDANMTSSDDGSVKSVKGGKVAIFKPGKDWKIFHNKFKLYASDRKFIDVLDGMHPDMPATFDGDMNKITDKKEKKVLKMNQKAVLALSADIY